MASMQVPYTQTFFQSLIISILLSFISFASSLLVPLTPINLQYHNGPLLAGDGPIKLYLTFYGDFAPLEKHALKSFLNSLSGESPPSYLVEASSAPLPKSMSLSAKHSIIRMGRRIISSSERAQANRFSTLKLRAIGSFSSSSSSSSSSFSSSSEHPKASGLPPLKLEASGFSSSELQASGSALSEQKASGSSSSKQRASGSMSFMQKASGSGSAKQKVKGSSSSSSKQKASESSPTVANWWSLTEAYTDLRGNSISQTVLLEHEHSDNYSLGKLLSHSDIALLATRSARRVSHDPFSIHIILTAADVGVEGFCMHACGQHAHTHTNHGELGRVVYAWVGNAREQCPGYCSWPFVRAEYGPDLDALKAPNSASVDGMIINLAKVLVETATNPYGDGYHIDSAGIGGVCTGVYGDGAYPGFPGSAYKDAITGASFNVIGLHQSKFLVPYIWNPLTFSCAVHP